MINPVKFTDKQKFGVLKKGKRDEVTGYINNKVQTTNTFIVGKAKYICEKLSLI